MKAFYKWIDDCLKLVLSYRIAFVFSNRKEHRWAQRTINNINTDKQTKIFSSVTGQQKITVSL